MAAFEESYRNFQRVKAQSGDPHLTFQVGIPGDLDMAVFVLGPGGALRHRAAFHGASLDEIRRIHEIAGNDVVFQLELLFELVLAVRAPKAIRRVVAKRLARTSVKLAADAAPGTRFGVHLCLGDMNRKAIVHMRDVSAVVALANALKASWPAGRPLEFVHAAVCGADQAPPLDDAYYAALSRLRLGRTRFVAGFAYEHRDLDEQTRLLNVIEAAVGAPVDVSASCGLGRRSLEHARASIQRTRELADSSPSNTT